MSEASRDAQTLDGFLDAVGSKTPAPGGGAVASTTAALAAAQALMVVRYSIGRKSLAEHAALHESAEQALGSLQARSLDLADEDQRAYTRVNTLLKLAEDDEERRRELPGAVQAAIDAPRGVVDVCLEILDHCERLADASNPYLISDLGIAAILAEAGARAAAWNVKINLPLLSDESARAAAETALARTLEEANRQRERIDAACAAVAAS